MELSSHSPELIGESDLKNWEVIGSGGFGQIYKARHVTWAWEVAIKILHYDDGSSSSLLREAFLMRRGESPYVVRVVGVFRGRLPSCGPSVHLGLVMDYMEQGSLANLQSYLSGPPPWPLAFRLVHQITYGMNFLHSLSPPILHLDLKPSNVLLDSSLNVKLTDFGLAKYYHSVSRTSKKMSVEGGTTSYMPPEAFKVSYKATRASDIYSYGIVLWSILTGKKPYPYAISSLVRLRIPEGDRPALEEIDQGQAPGLRDLVELMGRCWASVPTERPSFQECIVVTEQQYELHKSDIHNAVHQVQATLDKERKLTEGVTKIYGTQSPSAPRKADSPTGCQPVQETAAGSTTKNMVLDSGTDQPTFWPRTSPEVSSVAPNQAQENPQLPVPETMPRTEKGKPAKLHSRPNLAGSYQRQLSSPEAFNHKPSSVCINLSNVTGVQLGNNNIMHSSCTHGFDAERRRHPTAPPRVNVFASPNSGRQKGKTGTGFG